MKNLATYMFLASVAASSHSYTYINMYIHEMSWWLKLRFCK